ncbi:hypothetical protein C1645_835453 [Glomus cerebriforme]|uniref:F-box domain-containing protein n=1 Tax=Glomus cerebriforme TaxID=658196 RepID=A0A397SBZ9_9GLOM|nr:hypothetical protein C1645_835453 [Glomus cerebriforme]
MPQLSSDCLNDILEYLEDDMITLHSCLLVNRLWCEVSVRIFWRNSLNYRDSNLRTLIACLPTESKEILSKNRIIISTQTSKLPIFNYASFCKVLSIRKVQYILKQILRYQQSILFGNLKNNTYILSQELFKLFFNQIGSLKKLDLCLYSNINFNFYPETKDCLKNLPELQWLTDLISAQKNLKHLSIKCNYADDVLEDILSSLTNPNKISKLIYNESFKDFKKLQYAFFLKLQILKIERACPKYELLIKFLENNGKNLRECYISDRNHDSVNSLSLAITKFCPNLKKLFIGNVEYTLITL